MRVRPSQKKQQREHEAAIRDHKEERDPDWLKIHEALGWPDIEEYIHSTRHASHQHAGALEQPDFD